MAADDGADGGIHVAQHLVPALLTAVDEHDLLVVPRGGMAQEDRPEAVHVEGDPLGHALQELLMDGCQLGGAPHGQGIVGQTNVDALRHPQQLPVGVATDQDRPVAESEQTVEHLRRLRSPHVVPSDDDQLGPLDRGFPEHPVERPEHAVEVGEDGDGRRHATTVAREAASSPEDDQSRLCHQRLLRAAFSYGGNGVACPSKASGRSPLLWSGARSLSAR
ncbi:hypothetical protein LRE50_11005 [Clavibacter sepedonicus]|nr:hypothetical protein [Clavibacter sp.]UUK64813.1 hypothetical protein LRE50_11005 [Clavibacter sepedonicus]